MPRRACTGSEKSKSPIRTPRIGARIEDHVGGETEAVLRGGADGAPAAAALVVTALVRRILLGELAVERVEHRARQAGGPGRVRAGQEDIVPLLEVRNREQHVPGRNRDGQCDGRQPARRQRLDRADEHDHQCREQDRVVGDVVDRQADRRDHEGQHGNLLGDDHAWLIAIVRTCTFPRAVAFTPSGRSERLALVLHFRPRRNDLVGRLKARYLRSPTAGRTPPCSPMPTARRPPTC